MKLYYLIFPLIFTMSLQAQNVAGLNYGTTIAINEVDIEFVDVIEDSRCPLNVQCVQAGKAVVLVNVYFQGNFIEERKLVFHPSGFSKKTGTLIYNSDLLQITGLNLMPYPIAESKILKKDYYLELGIHGQ